MNQLNEIDRMIADKQRHVEVLEKDIEWLRDQRIKFLYDATYSESKKMMTLLKCRNPIHTH